MAGIDQLLLIGFDGLTADFVCPASVVLDGGDGERDIDSLGPSKSFP